MPQTAGGSSCSQLGNKMCTPGVLPPQKRTLTAKECKSDMIFDKMFTLPDFRQIVSVYLWKLDRIIKTTLDGAGSATFEKIKVW